MSAIRALIIDDSSVMRKIVERSLRQAGVNLTQVLEAGTRRRSSRRIRTEPCEITRSPNDQGKQQGNLYTSMSLSRERPSADAGYGTLGSPRNTQTGN
jgi:CheY-like chemotaxis protein